MLNDKEITNDDIPNEDINNQEKDDEISLIDLFAVLLRRKWLIIIITMLAAIGVVLYSVISLKLPPEKSYLPNTYTVTANMLIKDNNGSSSANLSGAAGAAASLMGINFYQFPCFVSYFFKSFL